MRTRRSENGPPEGAIRECVYCGEVLSSDAPQEPSPGARLAYDPTKGRLWEVCTGCRRWNVVPLALRWEALEACERAARDRGKVLLTTENLALIRVGGGELIRVGRPPRPEFAGWRYGDRVAPPARPRSFWSRLFGGLPSPPVGGYDPYGLQGMGGVGEESHPRDWTASPFMERASALTLAFGNVPLGPECPACGGPLALAPWEFEDLRFVEASKELAVTTRCAVCHQEVEVRPEEVRAGLRLGLSIVNDGPAGRRMAEPAGALLDRVGGALPFLEALARDRATVGELGPGDRLALGMALDEEAEAEALEREWREAEEITAIMDGELTDVPGFEEFRRRVLKDSV